MTIVHIIGEAAEAERLKGYLAFFQGGKQGRNPGRMLIHNADHDAIPFTSFPCREQGVGRKAGTAMPGVVKQGSQDRQMVMRRSYRRHTTVAELG